MDAMYIASPLLSRIRFVFVWAAVLSATVPTAAAVAATPPRKPNVIFVLVDDLGYADLEVYGTKTSRPPTSIGSHVKE